MFENKSYLLIFILRTKVLPLELLFLGMKVLGYESSSYHYSYISLHVFSSFLLQGLTYPFLFLGTSANMYLKKVLIFMDM